MTKTRLIADSLNFPTSLCFDDEGNLYIAESGLPFAGAPPGGRIWKYLQKPNGDYQERELLLKDLRPPLNGIRYHDQALLIAEGGEPGRLSRYNLRSGEWQTILDGLPGGGNYHTNMVIAGSDGKLYFGQGAATNSGIVGPDANQLAWLQRLPHPHDIPGRDLVLTGANSASIEDPATLTGAFEPYGKVSTSGQKAAGQLPCTAAVMRCEPDGSNLELVAWGLRNPYGIEFLADGRLLAVDLGINDRGSRPAGNVPDCIFEVTQGAWYGWPDYAAGIRLDDNCYQSNRPGSPAVQPLIQNHDELGEPAQPLWAFPVHAAPTRFAVHPENRQLYVALFGDKRPFTGVAGPKAGRDLVSIDLETGEQKPVANLPLHRPIDLVFRARSEELFVLDFGEYEMSGSGEFSARAGSGGIWALGS